MLPLLLQVGLLTRVPGEPMAVTPPNEYARRSLQKMLENALGASSSIFPELTLAVRKQNFMIPVQMATTELLRQVLLAIPNTILKGGATLKEASFHVALFAALMGSVPRSVAKNKCGS